MLFRKAIFEDFSIISSYPNLLSSILKSVCKPQYFSTWTNTNSIYI